MPDDRKKPLKFPTALEIPEVDDQQKKDEDSLQQRIRVFIINNIDRLMETAMQNPDKVAGMKAWEMFFKVANFGAEPPRAQKPIEISFVEIEQDDDGKIIRKKLA